MMRKFFSHGEEAFAVGGHCSPGVPFCTHGIVIVVVLYNLYNS